MKPDQKRGFIRGKADEWTYPTDIWSNVVTVIRFVSKKCGSWRHGAAFLVKGRQLSSYLARMFADCLAAAFTSYPIIVYCCTC